MKELTRKEEHILLAIYYLKADACLITIREKILNFTGKTYSVGTVYAPLNRLHSEGLLESHLVDVPDSNKPVRYYTMTNVGMETLRNLRKQTEELWGGFVDPINILAQNQKSR